MIVGGGLIVAASVSRTLWLFIAAFVVLFVLTGVGNCSIYKMIPTIFRSQAQAAVAEGADAAQPDRRGHQLLDRLGGSTMPAPRRGRRGCRAQLAGAMFNLRSPRPASSVRKHSVGDQTSGRRRVVSMLTLGPMVAEIVIFFR